MEQDLLEALRKEYRGETSPIMLQHLDFATSSRRRAVELFEELQARTGFSFRGKKILDVGCAYAGLVIEAARRGASAWGVEISRKFWEYGKLSARGEPGEIHLLPGNFTSAQIGSVLPRDFDFVFINDVFEHVYDTAGLLEQLQRVTAPGGGVFFSIPNGDSVRFVEREGHYGVAGVTLIPANWWHAIIPSFTAFYRPWSFYSGLFRAAGFQELRAWGKGATPTLEDARARIEAGVEKAAQAIKKIEYRDDKARPVVSSAFEEYRARVAADLKTGDVELLQWRYLTEFWRGCAYKGGPVLADIDVAPKFAAAGGEPAVATPAPAPVAAAVAVAPAPQAAFRSIDLAALTPEELVSPWQKRSTVDVSHAADGAVRCVVVAADDSSSGQYGGIRIPVAPLAEVRLDLEFFDVDGLEAIYLDGEDQRRCRVMRWLWRCKPREGGPPNGRETFALTPGRDCGPFLARDESVPGLVNELQLYVRLKPGQRATFVVHRAEIR